MVALERPFHDRGDPTVRAKFSGRQRHHDNDHEEHEAAPQRLRVRRETCDDDKADRHEQDLRPHRQRPVGALECLGTGEEIHKLQHDQEPNHQGAHDAEFSEHISVGNTRGHTLLHGKLQPNQHDEKYDRRDRDHPHLDAPWG